MKIINTSRDFTKVETYLMTQDNDMKSVKSLPDGAELNVTGWMYYIDTNAKGEESELLSVIGTNAQGETEVWTCQSATFKRSFDDIYGIFGDEEFIIKKMSGVTKANKDYVNCCLKVSK